MFKQYDLHEQIGTGSYGIVKTCIDRTSNNNKLLAIKIINLPNDISISKEIIDNSKREVEMLILLDHYNIVKYVDSFVTVDNTKANLYCIVMEYCPNGDLAKKISSAEASQTYFSESIVMTWFVQLSLAIQHMHRNNLLHRDLKPSNVYLSSDDIVKLGDFGIAKVLKEKDDMASTVIGTPYSLSPEICNSLPYSYASDMWGLGCILYELLTLKKPFEGKGMFDLVLKIVQTEPDLTLLNRYSLDVKKLVTLLLKKNVEERPTIDTILEFPFLLPYIESVNANNNYLKNRETNPPPPRLIEKRMSQKIQPFTPQSSILQTQSADLRKLSFATDDSSISAPSRKLIVGSASENDSYLGAHGLTPMHSAHMKHISIDSKYNSISSPRNFDLQVNTRLYSNNDDFNEVVSRDRGISLSKLYNPESGSSTPKEESNIHRRLDISSPMASITRVTSGSFSRPSINEESLYPLSARSSISRMPSVNIRSTPEPERNQDYVAGDFVKTPSRHSFSKNKNDQINSIPHIAGHPTSSINFSSKSIHNVKSPHFGSPTFSPRSPLDGIIGITRSISSSVSVSVGKTVAPLLSDDELELEKLNLEHQKIMRKSIKN